jgi:enoyl-CoA hydratase/carnithine racemase
MLISDRPAPDIVHLRLNDPARLNPLSLVTQADLAAALDAAMADPACRTIVIDGAGGNFSSGGDIDAMPGLTPDRMRQALAPLHDIVRRLVNGPKVVIAAVEGHCAGAGNSIAAACDIVVAASDARFTCSFVRIGLMPDLASLWTLPRRMGLGRARLFALTAERLDGTAAVAAGLADIACQPGTALETALSVAAGLRRAAPDALAATKRFLAADAATLDQALTLETDMQADLAGSAGFAEGVAAFREKRAARFRAT